MGLTASCLRCILLRHVNKFVMLNVNFVNYNVEIGLNMNHLSQNTPYYNKARNRSWVQRFRVHRKSVFSDLVICNLI
jgi:hypothetical protein